MTTEKAGGTGIREYNRRRVLAAFDGTAALSRGEIRTRTGLSRTTVADIVSELLAEGILIVPDHLDYYSPTRGRPPALLAKAVPIGHGIGIDIGHERLQVVISDLSGRILDGRVRRIGMDATAEESVEYASVLVRELLSQAGVNPQDCRAVCGIPEPIDSDGLVSRTSVQSRWHNTFPARLLSQALGIPVHVDNDANLAIVGETTFIAGRSVDHALYVKIAHGVGLGIVINGDLIRGATGLAGEIGHNVAQPGGIVCLCGNRGCLYTLTTSQFLTSSLHTITHNPDLSHDDLVELGRQGHPGAGRVLRDAGREVGRILANLCNTLNPSLVIVGGGLTRAGDWTLAGLREEMEDLTERQVFASLEIVDSRLGDRAELYGALAMAVGLVDPATGKRIKRDLS